MLQLLQLRKLCFQLVIFCEFSSIPAARIWKTSSLWSICLKCSQNWLIYARLEDDIYGAFAYLPNNIEFIDEGVMNL